MRPTLLVVLVFLAGWFGARVGEPPLVLAAGGPPDFAEAIRRADPSVVRVVVRTSGAAGRRSRDDGVGAGFVVDAAGLILTSRHVVAGSQRVIVTVPGRGAFDGTLVGQDEATDTALLRIATSGLRPLATGDPRALRVGQWVVAGGSPYNLPNSWSVGIVSGLGRENVGVGPRALRDFIQTDAAANLGNSGGPLLDGNGHAIGVMTAILSRTGGHQGVGLAVPIDAAMRAVERMRGGGGGVAQRPTLGVRVRALPVVAGRTGGLQVTGFDPGSAAQAGGVQVGDVILVAGGLVMRRAADLQRIVWSRRRGEVLRLTVQRGNRRFDLGVALR